MGSLEFALLFIVVFVFVIGIIEIGLGIDANDSPFDILQFVGLFWIWAAAGVFAWWRRPTNGIGGLLLIGAVSVLLVSTANVGVPALTVLSMVFATTPLAVAVHLLLAFPSGRIRGTLSTVTVVLGYITCIVFDSARGLTIGTVAFDLLSFAQSALGLTVMIMTAIVLARRLRAADAAHRRILLPLFAYGILAVLALPMIPRILFPLGADLRLVSVLQSALLVGLPIAFLLGVLLGSFTRTTPLEALSEWLAIRGASRPAVAQALASTLGDSTLRVVYWDAPQGGFVDEEGLEAHNDASDADRGWLHVMVDDDLVGAVDYDARMIAGPAPVRRAAEVLAIALDRERLTTQLLSSNEALLLSRIRIVEAADRERFRIARDLHDGLQMQLVLLGIEAQTIASSTAGSAATEELETLRRGIDLAAADLRRLVHDVLPAALLEQGLLAATEDLVDRLAVPATLHADLDETTIATATAHTAYFIVAEALSNTVKHARASKVRVTMNQREGMMVLEVEDDGIGGARIGSGIGLRGLADRVEALKGTIDIQSEPTRGTNVKVKLPCAL
ncbi:histidine kinase [Microbacterium sp. CH12i]|uniref:sensor histidine kinase n=1 Tax=Microbacterium sp. CH12i TaxID=1479651 RepID=UPI000461EE41|nr:ATP-binding protein [Microbacterium sp. CH12i]KDA05096.1 histidine kinase [Microbacterium sp. CH12i]